MAKGHPHLLIAAAFTAACFKDEAITREAAWEEMRLRDAPSRKRSNPRLKFWEANNELCWLDADIRILVLLACSVLELTI